MSKPIAKQIMSFADVSVYLGVHVTTLYRWCAAGTFVPKVRLGPARVGFAVADVDEWLARQRS